MVLLLGGVSTSAPVLTLVALAGVAPLGRPIDFLGGMIAASCCRARLPPVSTSVALSRSTLSHAHALGANERYLMSEMNHHEESGAEVLGLDRES